MSNTQKKDIYELKLHEEILIESIEKNILRVPGGWIYSDYDDIKGVHKNSTFVPFPLL